MGNSLIFTGLILLAGLAGGLIGSACGKRRNEPELEGRLAELEDRLDALATHCMDEGKRLKDRTGSLEDHLQSVFERLYEVEMLVGDTPAGGLLGRVSALEDYRKINDEEHRVLREVLLAVSKHGKVEGLEEALGFKKEAQDARG